jgi:hypothetical protein
VDVSGPPDFQLRQVILTRNEAFKAAESGDLVAFSFLAAALALFAVMLTAFPRLVFSDYFSPLAALCVLVLPFICLVLRRWAYGRAIMAAAQQARRAPGRVLDSAVVRALQGR